MTIQGWGNRRGRPDRPQVAVVGAGVAGLTAAYLLQRAYDVTLYEAPSRCPAWQPQARRTGGEYLAELAAVPGFYQDARRLLAFPGPEPLSLGEFLRQGGYRRYFVTHFVIPLDAAVWSCPPTEALAYPARYLFEFLDHHGMLRVARSPGWRSVTGGSRSYVERIAKQLTTVSAGVPVRAIRRAGGAVDIQDAGGGTRHLARAVIATHPDEVLCLLDPPNAAERDVLGAFRYTSSEVVLHTDAAVLPRAKGARASWNYLLRDCAATAANVHVSYHLSRLQGLDEPTDYLVTLNALIEAARALGVDW